MRTIGAFMILGGMFLVFLFPGTGQHQQPGMANIALIVGLMMLFLGVYLLFF